MTDTQRIFATLVGIVVCAIAFFTVIGFHYGALAALYVYLFIVLGATIIGICGIVAEWMSDP
jgi:hypothetical protein